MSSLLSRFTTFVPNATILSNDHNQELNRIVNLLNGTTTNLKTVLKTSDAGDPPLELDQLSTGPIQKWFQGGILKASVGNNGKIINDNVVVCKERWFLHDPTQLSLDADFLGKFIAPSGTGMRITKCSILRVGGGHGAGTSLTFQIVRNGTGLGSGIAFNDTNNSGNTEYSETLNQTISAGDKMHPSIAISGVTSELDITILMEWEQKLG